MIKVYPTGTIVKTVIGELICMITEIRISINGGVMYQCNFSLDGSIAVVTLSDSEFYIAEDTKQIKIGFKSN